MSRPQKEAPRRRRAPGDELVLPTVLVVTPENSPSIVLGSLKYPRRGIKCKLCRLSGHTKVDCPNANRTSKCKKCNEPGHTRAVCPSTQCKICFGFGHNRTLCPGPQVCKHCRKTGHAAKECPAPNDKAMNEAIDAANVKKLQDFLDESEVYRDWLATRLHLNHAGEAPSIAIKFESSFANDAGGRQSKAAWINYDGKDLGHELEVEEVDIESEVFTSLVSAEQVETARERVAKSMCGAKLYRISFTLPAVTMRESAQCGSEQEERFDEDQGGQKKGKKSTKKRGRYLKVTGFYNREVYHGPFTRTVSTVRDALSGSETVRVDCLVLSAKYFENTVEKVVTGMQEQKTKGRCHARETQE